MGWVAVEAAREFRHRLLLLVFLREETYHPYQPIVPAGGKGDYRSERSERRDPWMEFVSLWSPLLPFIFLRRELKLRVLPWVSLRVNEGKDSNPSLPRDGWLPIVHKRCEIGGRRCLKNERKCGDKDNPALIKNCCTKKCQY